MRGAAVDSSPDKHLAGAKDALRYGRLAFGVVGLVAAAGIAACGSSESKSIGEIRDCLTAADVQVGAAPVAASDPAESIFVPVSGGRNVIVEVAASEDEAQSGAEEWQDFGAAAGETGEFRVEGETWVGYPGPVPASLMETVEGCAF